MSYNKVVFHQNHYDDSLSAPVPHSCSPHCMITNICQLTQLWRCQHFTTCVTVLYKILLGWIWILSSWTNNFVIDSNIDTRYIFQQINIDIDINIFNIPSSYFKFFWDDQHPSVAGFGSPVRAKSSCPFCLISSSLHIPCTIALF